MQARLYHVRHIAGVRELPSCSWNYLVRHRLHKTALMWARSMIEAALEVGSVLVYCKRGANRSAGGGVLLKVVTDQDLCVEEAISFVRLLRPIVHISQADYKFIDECRKLARGQLFLQFRQPSAVVVTAKEFRTKAG